MINNTVLFYTHTARAFRTTLIGYLYEVSQKYPVVLYSEKLDDHLENLLRRRDLFPNLKEVIPVRQFSMIDCMAPMKNLPSRYRSAYSISKKNAHLCNVAKKAVSEHRPGIVITASDMHGLFEMYLLRQSKRSGALNICIQPTVYIDSCKTAIWLDLMSAYSNKSLSFLEVKKKLITFARYCGHFFYHWVLPLSAGTLPLRGKSSFILRRGNSGMRDSDFQVVFSEKDLQGFKNDNVPQHKLLAVDHPLKRKRTRDFFLNEIYDIKNLELSEKTVLVLQPAEFIGIDADNFSVIERERKEALYSHVLRMIVEILDDWHVLIKPHPELDCYEKLKEEYESISPHIRLLPPEEPIDIHILQSKAVVELPRAASTATFLASLRCPEKPIIAINFDNELLGDFWEHYNGIEYVTDERRFRSLLESIKQGSYVKEEQQAGEQDSSCIMDIIEQRIQENL